MDMDAEKEKFWNPIHVKLVYCKKKRPSVIYLSGVTSLGDVGRLGIVLSRHLLTMQLLESRE
jgi:hypothetical protein